MIEMKPIRKIQNEYLDLLKSNMNLFSDSDTNKNQLAYFFEEVSFFWLRRYEIINFFLNKIEIEDKCSFLAGAMYIDLLNYGHYEFVPCGKYHIFTDPVTKMRTFFSNELKDINYRRAKEYLNIVVIDCINVLSNYSDIFIVLPLDDIFSKDQAERMKFLKESSFLFISSLLINPCSSEKEFINKYNSIKEIEHDIKPELLNKLIFNSKSDVSLSLEERIEKNLNDVFSISSLKQRMSEAEIFLMTVGQFFMQIMDVILIAYSYKLIPFIRSDVVFNYLLMAYSTFSENKVTVNLLEQTVIAYLFVKIYGSYDFSKLDFIKFYNNICNNKIIDSIIEKSRSKGNSVFDLQINDLTSIIKGEFSLHLPI